jgi:hypothetical protein
VLGITYERMRAKAVKLIGERAVKILEKVFEYVKALITGGPAALWEKVKEDLGNLKEMVIDAIQSWLIETIVKQAAIKLVSLFNPAGAIIQAILAIYNVITFLIDKASQIMALIEAVINSVALIVAGNIGSAATWIENALGDTIPLVIGFLAQFIGLGGISKKIKDIITKVQNVVDKAIDKAIAKVVGFVKKLFGGGKDKEGKSDERTDAQKQADLDKGVSEADALLANESLTSEDVAKKLPAIQSKYKMKRLAIVTDSKGEEDEVDHIEGEVNPKKGAKPRKKAAKDKQTKIKVKRSTFTVTTKWTLAKDFADDHVKLVKGGRPPRLKRNLDRRHVVSSQSMAAHYQMVLNREKWSGAKKVLVGKGETVKDPLSNERIRSVAQSRHSKFFNDVKNLFVGDASENRSIGAEKDIPTDWTDQEWRKHLRYIKTTYALTGEFTP